MCRIAGAISLTGELHPEIESCIEKMTTSMERGGPDDSGIYLDPTRNVAFGHCRLSIIDTSTAGHQPMSNAGGTIWVTFNGEIYNYQALKSELEQAGINFQSSSDTEVLLGGYQVWGIEGLLKRLRGMFAFGLLDRRENSVRTFLVRDRFGIKPLYYSRQNEQVLFASEVRGLIASGIVDNQASSEAYLRFLHFGSVPSPLTTVEGVECLPPASYLEIHNDDVKEHRYWKLLDHLAPNHTISTEDLVTSIRAKMDEAVRLHMISDVPIGVFLSGGIDSSTLVAAASQLEGQLRTLSVVFDEEQFSEAPIAREVANKFGCSHHELRVTQADLFNRFDDILTAMDQPTIDGVNSYFVSEAARKDGLTVVLSGLGADEIFLGYSYPKFAGRFPRSALLPKALCKPITRGLSLLGGKIGRKFYQLDDCSDRSIYAACRGLFTKKQIQDLLSLTSSEVNQLEDSPEQLGRVEGYTYNEFNGYLLNQLLKDTDVMSMWHSLEARVPFLDHELVELVLGIPWQHRISPQVNKHLLVNAYKEVLPTSVWDRPKQGFTFPFEEWLRERRDDILLEIQNAQVFDSRAVRDLIEQFKQGKEHWSRLWALYVYTRHKL